MPRRMRDTKPSRAEIGETITETRRSLGEKEALVEVDADDHEIVQETIDGYEGSGTAEGVDQTERALTDAERTATEKFEEDDEALGQEQDDGQEYEQELNEISDAVEKDSGTIRDKSAPLQNDSAVESILNVKEALLRDREYLDSQISEIDQALQDSQSKRDDQARRVRSKGGR